MKDLDLFINFILIFIDMFRAIVGAILFIELGIPLIIAILGGLSDEGGAGYILVGIAIIVLIIIL